MTRGHHSKVGVGFVVEVETGIIIDLEVLCNYCQQCSKRVTDNITDTPAWRAKHKHCNQNYNHSSASMEATATCRLWSRSEEHGLRYTKFVGDGDTATHQALLLKPYTTAVDKEECLNHVSKRMGY